MLRYILLAIALLVLASIAFALIVSVLVVLALMALVAIPLWVMGKPHLQKRGLAGPRRHPIERLQQLYAEGKIDLFEFERRVEHLIAIEH